MPLELEYDSMDDVPEGYGDLYTDQEGKAVLTGVTGMKTQHDVDTVKEALRKERDDHSKVKTSLKAWGELKPDEVFPQLDRIKELEAAAGGKLDEEKLGELVEARLAQKTGPLERDIKTLTDSNLALTEENNELKLSIDSRERGEAVRSVATELKAHTTALPDIEAAASAMLEKNDEGQLITKSNIAEITAGVDAKAWMKEMQKLRPHWWPESQGGGAAGGGLGVGGGVNPFTAENWNLTEQGRVLKEQGREIADRLAKAAGTTVGGLPPRKSA